VSSWCLSKWRGWNWVTAGVVCRHAALALAASRSVTASINTSKRCSCCYFGWLLFRVQRLITRQQFPLDLRSLRNTNRKSYRRCASSMTGSAQRVLLHIGYWRQRDYCLHSGLVLMMRYTSFWPAICCSSTSSSSNNSRKATSVATVTTLHRRQSNAP